MSHLSTIALDPPTPVSPASGGDSQWLNVLASLLANGVSVEMAATRLGKPLRVVKSAMQMTEFKKLIDDIAKENEADTGMRLLQGTLLDSTLTLIRMRDDPGTSDTIKFRVCEFLIKSVIGTDKRGLGALSNPVAEVVKRAGGDLEKGLDDEISRMIENNPVLKSRLSPTSPLSNGKESESRGLASGALASTSPSVGDNNQLGVGRSATVPA